MDVLRFSTFGDPMEWYEMIRDRFGSLETISLMFQSNDGLELCLGAAAACHNLSNLSLYLKLESDSGLSLRKIFRILSTSRSLASVSLTSPCELHVERSLVPVQLRALKVLKLYGSMVVNFNEFLSAFPVLEELEYSRGTFTIIPKIYIASNTLQRLMVICDSHSLEVKAPKLTSLTVSRVTSVYCESAPTVACIQVFGAKKVICDASHVTLLQLQGSQLHSMEFPKLVGVRTLRSYESGLSMLGMIKNAALASAETGAWTQMNIGSQVGSFFNNMKHVKSVTMTSESIKGELPPGCLPELKSVRYVLRGGCDPSLLEFFVKSSPALTLTDLDISWLKSDGIKATNLMQMFRWVLQLQQSKPELTISIKS